MVITRAFVIRLTKMKETDRSMFLHTNRQAINFHHLSAMLKTLSDEALEKSETELAEKFSDIKTEIVLYEAHQRMPHCVSDIELVSV